MLVVAASYNPLIYVVASLLGGGGMTLLYQVIRDWRRAPIEDRQVIDQHVKDDIGNLKGLLGEYRLEVEVDKRRLNDYRDQLGKVTLELARAQQRITHLEDELQMGRGKQEELLAELVQVKARRAELLAERNGTRQEALELRERVKALEGATGIVRGRLVYEPPD